MASVLLTTFRNSLYRASLDASGYEVHEIPMPLTDTSHSPFEHECDFILFELTEDNLPFLEKINPEIKNSRIVCIASSVSITAKRKLFSLGISDVIKGLNPGEPAEYLNTLRLPKKNFSGGILIWDDHPGIVSCISRIAEGYGYTSINVNSIEMLMDKMRIPSVQFVLINISTNGLILKNLVAKSYADSVFKNSPVIIYKDLSSGIFVHEIISGLNRLTNCIVDYAEMFSFLAVNLFKKRIIPLYSDFGKLIAAEKNTAFSTDTLGRIIFSRGPELFEGDDIFINNKNSDMQRLISEMNSLVIQSSGFSWLVDEKKESVATCGGGAAVLHRP